MGIKFDYLCTFPLSEIEVLANDDGSGIIVISKMTDDEIDLDSLSKRDRMAVLSHVNDWAIHYQIMRLGDQLMSNEPHPANDQFGKEYVDGLNKDMGK